MTLAIRGSDGRETRVPLTLRIDTGAELAYVRRGGILPYVLDTLG